MTIEEWAEAKEGKPINEWPPLPDDVTHVTYPQGIVVMNKKAFTENLRNNMDYYSLTCPGRAGTKHCPILEMFK